MILEERIIALERDFDETQLAAARHGSSGRHGAGGVRGRGEPGP